MVRHTKPVIIHTLSLFSVSYIILATTTTTTKKKKEENEMEKIAHLVHIFQFVNERETTYVHSAYRRH